jgi:uncharacterized protein (DUF934 family)
MRIIKNRALVLDRWTHLAPQDDDQPNEAVIIDVERYLQSADYWLCRSIPWGIRIPNNIDLASIEPCLNQAEVICIDFPKYTDGRGYTLALLIRRMGYGHELRAIGDVLRDQLSFMERCGFDAYALKDGKDIVEALTAFDELGAPYQVSSDNQPAAWQRFGEQA